MAVRNHNRPSYTDYHNDSVRGLLAAVVLRVVRDADPSQKSVKSYYRETARLFLAEEGDIWLRHFHIPDGKVRRFIENDYQAGW